LDAGANLHLQRRHASAEQVHAGAAIHGSLEGLQLVDLSFGLPVALRLQHGVANSLDVLANRPRESLHSVDSGCTRGDQPGVQFVYRSTTKKASEPHRQTPHCRELRGRRLQRVDGDDLPGGHLAAGFDAKRRRGERRDHAASHRIQHSYPNRGRLLRLGALEGRLAAPPQGKETRQMCEGPCIAATAYLV
jgi:hypothetical protein